MESSGTFSGERKCQLLEQEEARAPLRVIRAYDWNDYHRLIEGGVSKEFIIKPEMKDSKLAAYWRSC